MNKVINLKTGLAMAFAVIAVGCGDGIGEAAKGRMADAEKEISDHGCKVIRVNDSEEETLQCDGVTTVDGVKAQNKALEKWEKSMRVAKRNSDLTEEEVARIDRRIEMSKIFRETNVKHRPQVEARKRKAARQSSAREAVNGIEEKLAGTGCEFVRIEDSSEPDENEAVAPQIKLECKDNSETVDKAAQNDALRDYVAGIFNYLATLDDGETTDASVILEQKMGMAEQVLEARGEPTIIDEEDGDEVDEELADE